MKRLAQALLVATLAATAVQVPAVSSSAGTTWQPLGPLSTGAGPVNQPQVAVDAGGNSVFVWQRWDTTTDCSGAPCLRIQTRSRSAAGVLGPIQTLSAAGRHSYLPQVAVDANGNAVFVWQRSDGTNLRIQTRARSAAGTLSGTQTISAAGQSAEYPQLAVDASGNAVFVWERWDGASERIQARTRWANATLGSTQTLSATAQDAMFPQVAVDPSGHAVLAWEISDGGPERIQARTRSADGTRRFHADALRPGPGRFISAGRRRSERQRRVCLDRLRRHGAAHADPRPLRGRHAQLYADLLRPG